MEWSIDLAEHLGPRRTQRCRRLAEAAIVCFAERGFAQTRVEHITDKAGLSRSQFYYFFEDKTDCFTACHRLCLAEMEARITAATANVEPWQLQLSRAVQATVDAFSQNPFLARLVILEAQLAGTEADKKARMMATKKLAEALEHMYRQAAPEVEVTALVTDMAIGSARQVIARSLEEDALEPEKTTTELTVALTASVLGPDRARRLAEELVGARP